ncbi:MAG: hypothetical protein FWC60_04885 [Firmicutes bacterium]|nr:hypothetical protein [Bacillota bacterium]
METKEKAGGKRTILPILLVISILLAAGGWGTAIFLHLTSTPRLAPGALKKLGSNELHDDSTLIQSFERRNSTEPANFTGKAISEDALQLLGWAATGKNRDGTGFVIPLAFGTEPYVSLYLAQPSGVRKFSWRTNDFEKVTDINILDQVNEGQNASAVWIYVIDKDNVPKGNMNWAWHAVGAMSEHQYLLADELNIQTRFLVSLDSNEVAALLGLDPSKHLPVGVMAMAKKIFP